MNGPEDHDKDRHSSAHPPADAGFTESQMIERVEEVATFSKRVVEEGIRRVSTVTDEVEELVTAEDIRHDVLVRRVPVDRVVTEAPGVRREGNTTILPVLEERVVVTTELVLVEEIHLISTETAQPVEVPITLRKQRIVEEKLPPQGAPTTPEDHKQEQSDAPR
ncbi:MAG: DUF2382 domain-containing protein [Paracoccus sp. (in: a-proteobacteria)]|nr:DUF2382 domain-containing protein [Paracoccus sp. (in: a-proteobacteria)]